VKCFYALCTRLTIAVHTLYDRFAFALRSDCNLAHALYLLYEAIVIALHKRGMRLAITCFALALRSLCPHFACTSQSLFLHTPYDRFAFALRSDCYRFAHAWHSPCNHFAIAGQSHYDRRAIALRSPGNRMTIAGQSHCDHFAHAPIALQSLCELIVHALSTI
jgi:hypothetical protein